MAGRPKTDICRKGVAPNSRAKKSPWRRTMEAHKAANAAHKQQFAEAAARSRAQFEGK